MRGLSFWLLVLAAGVAGAGGGGGTGAAWCRGPLPDLFPGRPVWLGAPPPAPAGKLVPLQITVRGGGLEDGVSLLDQLPNGADRPAGSALSGQSRVFLVSSKGRTVLFAQTRGGQFRSFGWPPGRTPAAMTITLSPGGVRLSVPVSPLPCRVPPS